MTKKTKLDLAAMLSVDSGELAAVAGGAASGAGLKLMVVATGTAASGGQSGDATDAKHEHTDDDDVSMVLGGTGGIFSL